MNRKQLDWETEADEDRSLQRELSSVGQPIIFVEDEHYYILNDDRLSCGCCACCGCSCCRYCDDAYHRDGIECIGSIEAYAASMAIESMGTEECVAIEVMCYALASFYKHKQEKQNDNPDGQNELAVSQQGYQTL